MSAIKYLDELDIHCTDWRDLGIFSVKVSNICRTEERCQDKYFTKKEEGENSSGWFVTEIILKILALVSAGLGHVPHVALPTEKLGLVLHLVWVVSHHVDVVERDMLGGEREQRGR